MSPPAALGPLRCPSYILGPRWVSGTALAAGGIENRRLAPFRSQSAFLAWKKH
jgi:hypothetical protein